MVFFHIIILFQNFKNSLFQNTPYYLTVRWIDYHLSLLFNQSDQMDGWADSVRLQKHQGKIISPTVAESTCNATPGTTQQ
jgi:citrate lyase synthetase